jgi:PAS domain S-box-containing protein
VSIYNKIFKKSKSYKLIFDSKGNILDFNENMQLLFNFDKHLYLQNNLSAILDNYSTIYDFIQSLQKEKPKIITYWINNILMEGMTYLQKIDDFYLLTITNVKKLTEHNSLIKESFNNLIETFPDPIFIYDKEDFIVYVNQAFGKFHGLEPKQIIGRHISEIYPPDISKDFMNNNKKVFESKSTFINESQVKNFKGEQITSLAILQPIKEENSVVGVIGTARNITKEKFFEQKLNEKLHFDEFCPLSLEFAQDCNKLLNSIQGYTNMIQLYPIEQEHLFYLEKINNITSSIIEKNHKIIEFFRKNNFINNSNLLSLPQNKTILLIGDNSLIQRIIVDYLNKMGYSIIIATSGFEGVEVFRSHESLSLVIVNYFIPDLTGLNVYCILKSINPESKIVFIAESDINKNYIENLDINGLIIKPIDLEAILDLIQQNLKE